MDEVSNNTCPICGEKDIDYNNTVDPSNNIWTQKCFCPSCRSKWDNIYTIVSNGYRNIEDNSGKKMMTCPNCNLALDHVEVHVGYDTIAKLSPPRNNKHSWTAKITKSVENNKGIAFVICPYCLESIPFESIDNNIILIK